MTFTLRPFQVQAIADLRALVAAGRKRVLLCAPTGFGKTIVIVAITRGHLDIAPTNRVLVVVHRRELVRQTVERLRASGLADVDVNSATTHARVVVASLQTLVSRGTRPEATLVVWDEAHHCPAASFRTVHGAYDQAIHIGATATPARADGKPLGDMFEAMVVGATVRQLTDAGLLVPSEVLAYTNEPTMKLAMHPLAAYQKHTPGRAAVVFCASVAHARVLADEFLAAGIRSACIDGKTSAKTRDATLAAFEAGDIDVITNCFVLTEGWSCDRADVCILARSPEHVGTLLQMVGRILRTMFGKRIATVLDLRGSTLVLGLPCEERRWALEGPACTRIEALTALRRCRECLAVFRVRARCPRCGAVATVQDRIPQTLSKAVKLQKLNDVPQAERDRRAVFALANRLRRSPKYAGKPDETVMRVAVFLFEKSRKRKVAA